MGIRVGDVLEAFEDQPDQPALLKYCYCTVYRSQTNYFSSRLKQWITFEGSIPFGNLSRINMEYIWPGMGNKEGSLKIWSPVVSPVTMKVLTLGCVTYSHLTSAEQVATTPPKCVKKVKFRMFSQELELASGALCQAFKRDTLYARGAFRNEFEASTIFGNLSVFWL